MNVQHDWLRRSLGALVGGVLGTVCAVLLHEAGYYAPAAAGAGVALGVSCEAVHRSGAWSIATALLAAAATLLAVWLLYDHEPFLRFWTELLYMDVGGLLSTAASLLFGAWLGFGPRFRRRPPDRD